MFLEGMIQNSKSCSILQNPIFKLQSGLNLGLYGLEYILLFQIGWIWNTKLNFGYYAVQNTFSNSYSIIRDAVFQSQITQSRLQKIW